LHQLSNQQTYFKQRQYLIANYNHRVPATQRNSRPISRVNIIEEDAHSVNDDLISFEQKINDRQSRISSQKYPNIELKRCFDAKNFRESNYLITSMASTRAGSLRSHVQTTLPRKHRLKTEASSCEAPRNRTAQQKPTEPAQQTSKAF